MGDQSPLSKLDTYVRQRNETETKKILQFQTKRDVEKAHSVYLQKSVLGRDPLPSTSLSRGRNSPYIFGQRRHSPVTFSKCPMVGCDKLFTNEVNLRRHIELGGQPGQLHRHSPCDPLKWLPDGKLKTVLSSHMCPECGELYRDNSTCYDHMKAKDHHLLHEALPVVGYLCPQCICVYPDQGSCHKHMYEKQHHYMHYPFENDFDQTAIPVPLPKETLKIYIKACRSVRCSKENSTTVTADMSCGEVFTLLFKSHTCIQCQRLFDEIPASDVETMSHQCDDAVWGMYIENNCKTFAEFVRRLALKPKKVTCNPTSTLDTQLFENENRFLPAEVTPSGIYMTEGICFPTDTNNNNNKSSKSKRKKEVCINLDSSESDVEVRTSLSVISIHSDDEYGQGSQFKSYKASASATCDDKMHDVKMLDLSSDSLELSSDIDLRTETTRVDKPGMSKLLPNNAATPVSLGTRSKSTKSSRKRSSKLDELPSSSVRKKKKDDVELIVDTLVDEDEDLDMLIDHQNLFGTRPGTSSARSLPIQQEHNRRKLVAVRKRINADNEGTNKVIASAKMTDVNSDIDSVSEVAKQNTPENTAGKSKRHNSDGTPGNLDEMNHIIFLDLDNWPSFFKKLPYCLPEKTFVWAFYGGATMWKEPKCITFQNIKANDCFYLHNKCGRRKDAADFAICLWLGRMDERLPKNIPFTILSGDHGFHEVEKQMQHLERRTVVINPHHQEPENVYGMLISVSQT